MALQTGTYTIADLSANAFASTTVAEFGIENLNDAVQEDLRIHNERIAEMLRDLAEVSVERSTIYGTSTTATMVRKDQYTRGPTQKASRGSKVEFPLDGFQFPIGWTAEYLRRATVQDFALRQISARQAHVVALQTGVKEALFGPTNFTWTDRLVDSNDLAVKRLVNADSGSIPNGPNGETFDGSTHTHYDAIDWAAASADAKAAALAAAILDVVEHGHGNDVRVYINVAQATDVAALEGFTPVFSSNVMVGANTDRGMGTLDITRADNRLIGYFNGYPVSTKPWVPANYILTFSAGDPRKPLRYRQSTVPQEQGLFIAGQIITHPLQAEYFEAFFGFGVYTRTNGSVLYLGSGTYTAPTF